MRHSHRIVMEDAKPVDELVPTGGRYSQWPEQLAHPIAPRVVDVLEAQDIVVCGEVRQVTLKLPFELLVV